MIRAGDFVYHCNSPQVQRVVCDVTPRRLVSSTTFAEPHLLVRPVEEFTPWPAMVRVGLVACSAAKAPHPAPAKEMYRGQLFRLSRAYVEQRCDRWFILSAKHGLLDPEQVIEPYDVSLRSFDRQGHMQWSADVTKALADLGLLTSDSSWTILAGRRYWRFITPALWKTSPFNGLAIDIPLQAASGIGVQLRKLKDMLAPRLCPNCGSEMAYWPRGYHWDGTLAWGWRCYYEAIGQFGGCCTTLWDGDPPWTEEIGRDRKLRGAYWDRYGTGPIQGTRPPANFAVQPRLL